MKKVTIASFILIALIGVLIAATPKKQMPPNFETSWTNFTDAAENWYDARHSGGDSITTKASMLLAAKYVHDNWTDQQVNDNVAALWPMPAVFYYGCAANCSKYIYSCITWNHDGTGNTPPGPCEAYEQCKANCH